VSRNFSCVGTVKRVVCSRMVSNVSEVNDTDGAMRALSSVDKFSVQVFSRHLLSIRRFLRPGCLQNIPSGIVSRKTSPRIAIRRQFDVEVLSESCFEKSSIAFFYTAFVCFCRLVLCLAYDVFVAGFCSNFR